MPSANAGNCKKNVNLGSVTIKGIEGSIAQKVVTYDFARMLDGAKEVKCSEFSTSIIDAMKGLSK